MTTSGFTDVAKRYLGIGPAEDFRAISAARRAALLVFQVACVIAVIVVDPWWAKIVLLAVLAVGSAVLAIVGTFGRRVP